MARCFGHRSYLNGKSVIMENADCMVERLHLQSAFARSQANAHRTVCLTARRLRELWRLTPYMRPTVPETPHGVSLATGAHRAPAKRSARVGRRASRALRPTRLRPCNNGPLRGLNTAFAIPSALRPQPRLQTVHRTVCLTARRLRELWRLTPKLPSDPMPGAWWRVLPGRPGIPPEAWPSERQPRRRIR